MGLRAYYKKNAIEAGCDEAGRGCLAGPVFAAAVILPDNYKNTLLRDSKKLTELQREELFISIKKEALSYSVQKCSNREIDKINILNAAIKAMNKAVGKLSIKPQLLLIDGNRFHTNHSIPYECIIKGDDKFYSIAAASVLAKVSRDRYMKKQSLQYPQYLWESNKGYPTAAHREALFNHGLSPLHRQSFNLFGKDPPLSLF